MRPTAVARVSLNSTGNDANSEEHLKMKKLYLLTLLLLAVGVSAAKAQDVRYNFAQGEDFTKYKTYDWVSIKNAGQVDELTAKQITSALDAELVKKGLTKSDSDTADRYIGYQTAIGTQKQLNFYNSGWGYGPGWRGGRYGGMGMSTTTATTSTIDTGQLALDMYDAAKKELVWRGVASKTLDPKAKPDKRQKNITKGVEKLLKNYPPKTKT
jgi:opacity protein-like surface antigen